MKTEQGRTRIQDAQERKNEEFVDRFTSEGARRTAEQVASASRKTYRWQLTRVQSPLKHHPLKSRDDVMQPTSSAYTLDPAPSGRNIDVDRAMDKETKRKTRN